MGANYIDYIIADRITIPRFQRIDCACRNLEPASVIYRDHIDMDRRPERASQHSNVSQLRVIDSEVWRNETLADLRAAAVIVRLLRGLLRRLALDVHVPPIAFEHFLLARHS